MSLETPPNSAPDLATQLAELRELLATATSPRTSAILTTAEAIAYTKHESPSAFYRWCRRTRVRSSTNGRFSRAQIDVALSHEGSKARFRRPEPRTSRGRSTVSVAA